jgi:hypothetical protein
MHRRRKIKTVSHDDTTIFDRRVNDAVEEITYRVSRYIVDIKFCTSCSSDNEEVAAVFMNTAFIMYEENNDAIEER